METKVRKKMYKKGKFWVVATITTAMLTGIGLSSVQADEANSTQVSSELAERSQVQENTTASSSAAENQAKTEVQETPSTNPAAATVENTDQTTKVITDNAAVESKASKTKDQAATVTKTAASTPEVGQTNEKAKATKEADITTPKNTIDEYGLTEQARKIATEAGINLSSLTQKQVEALNKVKLTSDAQTGHQMTYQEFDKIAQTLIA